MSLPYHLQQLADLCIAHPADRKVVFAPSAQVGYAIVNALALSGVPTLNLQIGNPEDVARHLAEPQLLTEGMRPLVRDADAIAFDPILEAHLDQEPENPFAAAGPSPGLSRAIHRTIRALRIADVRPEQLDRQKRDAKLQALARLFVAYQDLFKSECWYDGADIFATAIEVLDAGYARPPVVAILDETPVQGLARDFVRRLGGDTLIRIGRDGEGTPRPSSVAISRLALPEKEANGVRPAGHLLARPVVARDLADLHVVTASGPEVEARDALHDLLCRGCSVDTAEIAYTAETPYLAAIHNAAARFEIGATYGAGVPVTLTRPGKALVAFYEWIGEGFPVDGVVRACRSGLIALGPTLERGETLEPYQFATWLLQSGVRAGLDSYERVLNRIDNGLPHPAVHPEHEAVSRRVLGKLLSVLPREDVCSAQLLSQAGIDFLTRFVPFSGEGEAPARDSLIRRLTELHDAIDTPGNTANLAHRFARLVSDHRIQAGAPRPGSLNVVPLSRAGYAGRPNLYILGLDEGSFPGGATEDPILLDDERSRVSEELDRVRSRPTEAVWHFVRLLGAASGPVTLYASTRTIRDGRETFPSPLLQQIVQIKGEKPRQASLLPAEPDAPGLNLESWMLLKRGHPRFDDLASASAPEMVEGLKAQASRYAFELTRFDGFLGHPDSGLGQVDPDLALSSHPQSASRLEDLVRCPYRYFLRHVLRLTPLDEGLGDPTRWLTPLQFGDLLHQILRKFMDEIRASGRQARPDDADRLQEILRHQAETHRTWYPEPGPEAYAVDFRRLAHACEVFLASEVKEPPGDPLGFEVSFGFDDASGLNHPDVVDLDLGEGLTIPLRGLIDRVDRLADRYAIWDYKTGSAYGYDESDLLKGLHLQWALYGFVLQEILRLRQDTKKPIVSGYFFTSDREHGRRIRSVLPTRKEVGDLLRPLARLAERGAFPHIQRQDACRFCDYAGICGGEQLLPEHLEDLNDSNPDLPVEIETWLNV